MLVKIPSRRILNYNGNAYNNHLNGNAHRGRPEVKGKFIYKGNRKIYLKGVTYGTFKPRDDGYQFPDEVTIKSDLLQMAEEGFNCVRTYTVPSKALLDLAYELNIYVMVGLPWEQ